MDHSIQYLLKLGVPLNFPKTRISQNSFVPGNCKNVRIRVTAGVFTYVGSRVQNKTKNDIPWMQERKKDKHTIANALMYHEQ